MPSTRDDPGDVTPRLSVIIPARNADATIAHQLRAVCAQEVGVSFEVVVVDNGSTDDTEAVVTRASEDLPQVRLVAGPSRPNRSAARNVGAAHAAGALLAFCDADDIAEPGWLQGLVAALDEAPVVTGGLRRVRDLEASSTSAPMFTTYRGLACLASGNFAIAREVYEQVGGFSEAIRHRVDIELSCRLYLLGIEVQTVPEACVRYVRRADLRGEARQHFWWAMADVQIMKAYRGRVPLQYSSANSLKHWALVGPRLVRAVVTRADLTSPVLTLAALVGRLAGSVRYRTRAI